MIGIATAVLLSLPNPLAGVHLPHGDITTRHYGLQGWRIDVRKDRFSNETTCRLHRGSVSVEHGVVLFRLGSGANTAAAQFRIDDGPMQTAGSVAVESAGLGQAMTVRSLTNPSGGNVAIPLRLVEGAHEVSIRPDPKSRHRTYRLNGLSAAAQAARDQGCDSNPAPPPHP